MNFLFTPFLILHILGGAVGLLTGTYILATKKGTIKHKAVGRIFVYGMLTTGFSSLVLAVIHPSYFLFMVGVFTLYMVGTGNRYIYYKLSADDRKPGSLDWAITYAMLLFGVLFIGLGIWFLVKSDFFGVVLITFGAVGLRFVSKDFSNYKGRSRLKNYWLLAHLQRMIGGYIAAVTAFLVVNEKYAPVDLPSAFVWLLPTIILVPLIIRWSRKYEIKKQLQ